MFKWKQKANHEETWVNCNQQIQIQNLPVKRFDLEHISPKFQEVHGVFKKINLNLLYEKLWMLDELSC